MSELKNYLLTIAQSKKFSIVDSGSQTTFSSGAVRDNPEGKPPMELLPMDLLARVSVHYGLGAKKYGANNWRRGQSVKHCIASVMRHLMKYQMGMEDEDHLSAIVFNVLSIMNVEVYHKGEEVDDFRKSWKDGKPTGE